MTQPAYQVDSRASIQVRAIVLPRTVWESTPMPRGAALRPVPGTWYGHMIRGKRAHDVTTVAMVGCPSCGNILYLSHTREAANVLGAWLGQRQVPVAHMIDTKGKVSPDLRCQHPGCGFHRTVYLDRWHRLKALYAVAYVLTKPGSEHGEILIDYCHAVDRKEALYHFGLGTGARRQCRVIDAGPAVGFFVDERTGRITAD